jgi:hypothetical protein
MTSIPRTGRPNTCKVGTWDAEETSFLKEDDIAEHCLNDWPLERTPDALQAGGGRSKIAVEEGTYSDFGAKQTKAQRGLK